MKCHDNVGGALITRTGILFVPHTSHPSMDVVFALCYYLESVFPSLLTVSRKLLRPLKPRQMSVKCTHVITLKLCSGPRTVPLILLDPIRVNFCE